MKESKSNNRVDRRDFITKGLACGAFVGMGCPGLLAMNSQEGISNLLQDEHKFQTATNFNYEQLFNFTFRSWFISYMKRLQEEIGTGKFLELLMKAGDKHYRSRVKSNFEKIKDKYEFKDIIPVSAMKGDNIEGFEKIILDYLPPSEAFYDEDQITDRSERFMAAEIIREKLTRNLLQELPYNLTVEIEKFTQDGKLLDIAAIIWVERDNQKAIIIGKGGSKLKDMGTKARIDMEKMFGQKVFLQLWVKVKSGWSDDERALNSLGYIDDY